MIYNPPPAPTISFDNGAFTSRSGPPINDIIPAFEFGTGTGGVDEGQYAQGFPANNTINASLLLDLPTDQGRNECEKGVGVGEFCIVTGPETGSYKDLNARRSMTWSTFNTYLSLPEQRATYGKETDCKSILEKFKPFGVAQRNIVWLGNTPTPVHVFHVGGRVKVHNLFATCGEKVRDLWHLSGVFERLRYRSKASSTLGMDEDNDDDISGPVEHYWRLRPWAAEECEPPLSTYIRPDFTGHRWKWGQVIRRYGIEHSATSMQTNAEMAAFPYLADTLDYRPRLHRLNMLEVALGVH